VPAAGAGAAGDAAGWPPPPLDICFLAHEASINIDDKANTNTTETNMIFLIILILPPDFIGLIASK
jgi:hypothetical protein